MNRRELEERLQKLLEGKLEASALDELQHELRTDPEARVIYRDYVHLQNALQLRATGIDCLRVISMTKLVARRQRRYLRNALLSTAAIIAIFAIAAALVHVSNQSTHITVVATAGASWTVDGKARDAGVAQQSVTEGSRVNVMSGTLKLKLESGSVIALQGPATVSFPKVTQPQLESGWMWIDSTAPDESFDVETPDLRVRDIGTRFGVRVPAEGPAEIHLIDGTVQASLKKSGQMVATLKPRKYGVAITGKGESFDLPLATDPFPALDELGSRPASYSTTVCAQNPSGYWRLDAAGTDELANEIRHGVVGLRQSSVGINQPGPGPENGFNGFAADNRAASLPGTAGMIPLSLGASRVHRGVLLSEDFKGDGLLDGLAPDGGLEDARWVAASSSSRFNGDGSFVGKGMGAVAFDRGGSATLAFSPVDGVLYTLNASLRGVATIASNSVEPWIAVGFADGQSAEPGEGNRFTSGTGVSGRAWMLLKRDRSKWAIESLLGTSGTDGGVADLVAWKDYMPPPAKMDIDLRLLLDTRSGPGNWTATWLAKRSTDDDFITVRSTATLINEAISSVGFAVSSETVTGRIDRFSLSAKPVVNALDRRLASAPARMARREGAVSFWMRRDPEGTRREMIWSAGETSRHDSIAARIGADGRFGFFMDNGRYDVLLNSERSVNDGQWHHLAASWSPSAVDIYIDGKMVGSDNAERSLIQGYLPELRFGSGSVGPNSEPYKGWIDEIAVWDRALTPYEVQHQFVSGAGRPSAE